MIKLIELTKKYSSENSSLTVLKDINLEIKEGEFVALLGPSGSGKSTLLNLIGGLDTPSEGKILFKSKEINKFTDEELSAYRNSQVGFIFQEFHLQNFLSVLDNILLPTNFTAHSDKNAHQKAIKLINEVGLESKTNTLVKDLSGGQKQRVAIARALINNPKLILADEPTGNLDNETGSNILNLLENLHKTHKTTLLIATHDEKIAKKANRVIKLKESKLISE